MKVFALIILFYSLSFPLIAQPELEVEGDAQIDGQLGVGIASPDSKLHVLKGSAGSVTAFTNSIGVFESNTNGYISILTPESDQQGIIFGNPTDNAAAFILHQDMFFFNSGVIDGMTLLPTGQLGLRATPSSDLHIKQSLLPEGDFDDAGIRLENNSNTDYWNIYTVDLSNAGFVFSRSGIPTAGIGNDGAFVDFVSFTSNKGSETKNIKYESMGSVLGQVKKLKPLSKNITNGLQTEYEWGFVTEDIAKLFPEIIREISGTDIKGIIPDYFGILSVKAIQELATIVEDNKMEISFLTQEMSTLQENANTTNVLKEKVEAQQLQIEKLTFLVNGMLSQK